MGSAVSRIVSLVVSGVVSWAMKWTPCRIVGRAVGKGGVPAVGRFTAQPMAPRMSRPTV